MPKHSTISASQCYRWWNCPGSVALCKDIPPQPPSPYAMEGTAAHELAERSVSEQCSPYLLVGEKAKNSVTFTTEMAKHVLSYLSVLFEDAEKFGIDKQDVKLETKFHLTDIDEEAYGTCDAYFVQPFGRLCVYDLKYGAGTPVQAENNLQMQYYALGALAQTLDCTEVEMVIVQPRTDEQVKRWVISVDEMDMFRERLKAHIGYTRRDNPPLSDGSWCKWCPALALCPQVSKKAIAVAQTDFLNPSVEKGQNALPLPGVLTTAQLKLVLDKAELLQDWLTAVESHAKSLLEAGTIIEGWKLVPKRAHRKWKDEFEVETALADFGGDIYDKKLKTPKQMEAVVGKEKVTELSEVPDNGTTLAKDEDKREEAKIDFTEITNTTIIGITNLKQEKKRGKRKIKKSSDTDFQSIFS